MIIFFEFILISGYFILNSIEIDKGFNLVDPDSGLKETTHVYCGEFCGRQIKFMAVLGLVDIENNKNSYHRMQLLESNDYKS